MLVLTWVSLNTNPDCLGRMVWSGLSGSGSSLGGPTPWSWGPAQESFAALGREGTSWVGDSSAAPLLGQEPGWALGSAPSKQETWRESSPSLYCVQQGGDPDPVSTQEALEAGRGREEIP
jgi:hypothetical protein